MSKQKIRYNWYEEAGLATCTIEYKDKKFSDVAMCHPDDLPFCSKLTGQFIAEYRANIQLLKYIKNCEIKPQLKILNTLYNDMKTSKHFNPKSYESISLFRKIHFLEKQLTTIEEELSFIDEELKDYIKSKDESHERIKKFREKKALVTNN